MADFIDCTNNQIPIEAIIAALMTKDSSGNWAIRTMYVEACATDAIDCDTKNLTPETMFRKCLGVDPVCGKLALRLQAPAE